jgi:hypothetical protein
MESLIAWLLDYRDPWHWLAAAGSLLAALARAGRGGGSPRWRSLVDHLHRERQHAKTMLALWQAQEDLASQQRQIDLMEQRMEDLLDGLFDGLSPGSRAALQRRIQQRKQAGRDLPASNAASPASKRS